MKITPEHLKVLTALGFGDVPDCEPSFVFHTDVLACDTRMSVAGEHATDCAYIYYANLAYEQELLDGFFFAPSMLEHLIMQYPDRFHFDPLLQKLNHQLGTECKLVFLAGIPMLFIEVAPYEWVMGNVSSALSDILKIVGASEYILNGEQQRLYSDDHPMSENA